MSRPDGFGNKFPIAQLSPLEAALPDAPYV